jgi:hypothetical protein
MTRLVWQLVCTLLVVGFMLKYWWFIALVVAVVIVFKRAPVGGRRIRLRRRPRNGAWPRSSPGPTSSTPG